MTAAPRPAVGSVPRGRFRTDLVYLGWQRSGGVPEPGPAPEPPRLVMLDEVSEEWLAAQRRELARLARPARLCLAAGLVVGAGGAAGWLGGVLSEAAALPVAVTAACAVAASGWPIWRGRRELAGQVRAERQRVARMRAVQASQLAAAQRAHAMSHRAWRQASAALLGRPQWHPVTVPAAVQRVDVAGGTQAGWSALLTMIAAPRLAAGGAVTVLDLTEGSVAGDLLSLAARWGLHPAVWVLPADLPRLELGTGLSRGVLADVLALTVSAAESQGRHAAGSGMPGHAEHARDAALLSRVLELLGDDTTMTQLTAGLAVLAQVGGAREKLDAGPLRPDQVRGLVGMFGRGTDRLVAERAFTMEAVLRTLDPVATALAVRPASRLKVAWLDRRAPAVSNAIVGSYLVVALTARLRQAPVSAPWQQTVCLLGAERLPGDVLDRLCDATQSAGAGLVLGYRSIPAQVRERLGRGDAAVAFMRLGNADDARVAAEQIGTEHRFVLSQLTDTVGAAVTDTFGDSYTSTVGTADSVTASGSLTAGRSRARRGSFAPFADFAAPADASSSATTCDSRAITEGISASTSWGLSTSRAVGTTDSLAAAAQRSREFLVEQHELQHLPHSAVVLCHTHQGGRRVVLADANPAIMTLRTATLQPAPPAGPDRCGSPPAVGGR